MADRTGIEWTDSTFNPWIGCTKISPACDHCYAAVSRPASALGVEWGAGKPRRRTSAENWKQPLRWNAEAYLRCFACHHRYPGQKDRDRERHGYVSIPCPACGAHASHRVQRRVFCASLADVFDKDVDIHWLVDLLDLIRRTPTLHWQLLTKRIGNVGRIVDAALVAAATNDPLRAWIVDWWSNGKPPHNVWLGATICDQTEADRDIPKLLATPAAVRFLSIEPLLERIDLRYIYVGPHREARGMPPHFDALHRGMIHRIDWVIAGGESGSSARPMHPTWVRALRDQCAAADVPFLFKQWGEWAPVSEVAGAGQHHSFLGGATVRRVGKKAAGRLLDGVEHNGLPGAP